VVSDNYRLDESRSAYLWPKKPLAGQLVCGSDMRVCGAWLAPLDSSQPLISLTREWAGGDSYSVKLRKKGLTFRPAWRTLDLPDGVLVDVLGPSRWVSEEMCLDSLFSTPTFGEGRTLTLTLSQRERELGPGYAA